MTGFPEVMNPRKRLRLTIFIISLLHVILPATAATAYNATEIILLDCGAPVNTTTLDGRSWEADTRSKYSSFNQQSSSFPSNASRQDTSVSQVPYLSALIIQSNFTYSFPVSPGPKFLRLYFYPEQYSHLDMTASFFSVTANSYTLLKNFSAHLTASAMYRRPVSHLIKEFIVTVRDSERLNITFSPSPNSYAFINAIEVVSMPSLLYTRGDDINIPLVTAVGALIQTLDDTTSLETVYRLNVGGNQIENTKDTGMYRTWQRDEDYVAGGLGWTVPLLTKSQLQFTGTTQPYTAPDEVYTTSRQMTNDSSFNMKTNLTWIFPVDAGFSYLVRLHFCELWKEVTGSGQHVFDIFINQQKAARHVDVFEESGGHGFPIYKDYIVMGDSGIKGKDLTLELHPQNVRFVDAFLNGLEIFKLNQTNGNLAGPNPDPSFSPSPPDSPLRLPKNPKSEVTTTFLPILGAILGGFALFSFLLGLFIFQRRRKLKDSISFTSKFSTTKTYSSLPSDLCRQFSIAQIKAATQDFDDQFLIGSGGFGNVYRGIIDGVTTTVAIKRLNSSSRQGAHEFHTEITMLSKLRHMHLVSLIGYCDDHGEMILVYDYMPRGTLRDHLYQTKNPPLSWKQRLEICIGAARGLHYLHKEAKHCIIHRDVKSSNILLDENYVAKVSDFGLSKLGPTSTSQTHVSTVVKGSLGYVDPEYYLRQRLTEKSDVYSFGVVLFEVLCGRPPMIQGLSKEKANLAHWASSCYLKGLLDQIIDPCLKGQIAPIALQKFGEVAEKCVRNQGTERPTMGDIVWALEFTLQLQEAVDGNTNSSSATPNDDELFSGSSATAAKSQQSVSDTTCSITVGDLSSKTKISEKDTSRLLFGDDN
ncbi:hypothetical protein SLEP1_g56875 [Rubroshorea leprosula]|uniref:Protein kinase domain-containing protein n=1 Tax=Rubroshorea leprosula TaxID=152421 RepID=A0AAV5MKW0_9ROSI|nr:hypothetical protein SLEP1_g56875 [Rubroshorea leprosula]